MDSLHFDDPIVSSAKRLQTPQNYAVKAASINALTSWRPICTTASPLTNLGSRYISSVIAASRQGSMVISPKMLRSWLISILAAADDLPKTSEKALRRWGDGTTRGPQQGRLSRSSWLMAEGSMLMWTRCRRLLRPRPRPQGCHYCPDIS